MEVQAYKLDFQTVHFGNGNLNESIGSFNASRLYSSLFLESLKLNVDKEFLNLSKSANFFLSDSFPLKDGEFYLPKPIGYPKIPLNSESTRETRRKAKRSKKLRYIKYTDMEDYVEGNCDVDKLDGTDSFFSKSTVVTKKGIDPYEVGITNFKTSLYILTIKHKLLDMLMNSLQYSGIGGKRSSGYGRFTVEKLDIPDEFSKNIVVNDSEYGVYMTLSTSIPNNDELDSVLPTAEYLLEKSSGFAYSSTSRNLLRKQDLYKFAVGTTLTKTYNGNIFDVRPDGFSHPVWNYAKGLFYKLPLLDRRR
ncbi:type III-A CRISPR-associated RAMP protein Csm4 [Ligilactobacillus salivarius]|uniref:CRISPR system Cms protein Csm4 n=1 Tax=Ligilactobacillus salivarius NIAS840 TaxID=1029822 RepID=F5VF40_9LACO|nr:type III-A CRISPR-associated RAMP protein Csm4 [Ligilactobacillus salivarius]EGL99458.1 CRISPR-associated RAMP protein, Csm4 family [Ligilactobacillus salivarius NIAS840]MDE1506285.1 type III-A CRISPR-associated RAMP protein Csm4 [Ligilactobacillus salivarius]MDE1521066.1 type III-A CRISPR-associated RAMP protein Csm4 [Ligilactobacillus salivarius]HIS17378.1 type III-A CRISPR-associated RAMP protein Csm4 [Candidatus Coprovivens excrementavium]